MKKLDFAQTVGLLANIGVITGILFLGYEMRQNTNAIQASTLQGMVDLTTSYLIDTSLDEGFIQVLSKAQANPDQLTDVEELQLQRVLRSQWFRYESAYMHWRRGSLGEAEWERSLKFICGRVENVGEGSFALLQARFWRLERFGLTDDFVAYVESCRPDLAAVGG